MDLAAVVIGGYIVSLVYAREKTILWQTDVCVYVYEFEGEKERRSNSEI